METVFRQHATRLGATGGLLAVAVVLISPGTASAEPTESAAGTHTADNTADSPVVVGSCEATLRDSDGAPLTVDAGALLGQPGVLDVGLGKDSGSLLSLPVKEALGDLGISEAELLVSTAGELCDTGKVTVNELTGTLRQALPEGEPGEPDPGDPGEPTDPGDPAPVPEPAPAPAPEAPNNPTDELAADASPGATNFLQAGYVPGAGQAGFFTAPEQTVVPPAAAVPPAAPPEGAGPGNADTGRTQALATPDAAVTAAMSDHDTPGRLPVLLAVTALVVVTGALAHVWLRRGTA